MKAHFVGLKEPGAMESHHRSANAHLGVYPEAIKARPGAPEAHL
jgi:hypothetical protein